MGKYMKKSKLRSDTALRDSTIGVRTRAKTLALKNAAAKTTAFNVASHEIDASSFCYLQLRSRRLEKCLLPKKKNPKPTDTNNNTAQEIEPSFGDNNLDFQPRDSRGTRESTPCSFTRDPDSTGSPASTTRRTSSAVTNRRIQNDVPSCITPTMQEIEDFFSTMEQQNQSNFIEKYNFDIVNDKPLPGRYEWVPVTP